MIAREIMKQHRVSGVVYARMIGERERATTEIRFTWIPGIRPVNIPENIPMIIAKIIWSIY